MHFVQDLTRVGRSVEDLDLDEISLEAIDNAIERAKNMEAFIKQSKSVSATGDPFEGHGEMNQRFSEAAMIEKNPFL